MLTLRTSLDMTPGSENRVVIPVSQYDTAVTIIFTLYASADAGFTIPVDTTASVRGTKTDGNGVSKAADISGNVVTVELDEQMTAVAGKNVYEIVLEADGKKLSSQNFVLLVERAAMDKDTLVSGSEIRELVDIVDRTDEIIAAGAQADAAKDAIEEAEASLLGIQASVAQDAEQVAADRLAVEAAEARIAPVVAAGVEAVNSEYAHHVTVIQQGTDDLNALATQLRGEIADAATDGTAAVTAYKDDALLELEHAFDAATASVTAAGQANVDLVDAAYAADKQRLDDFADQYLQSMQDAVDQTNTNVEYVDEKTEQIRQVTTSAETFATQALQQAASAKNQVEEFETAMEVFSFRVSTVENQIAQKIDDFEVANSSLYGLSNGERVAGPVNGIGGGGGGGGTSGNTAVFRVNNETAWLSNTIAVGDTCPVRFSWSSIEDEMPTGAGKVRVADSAGIVYDVIPIQQGTVEIDLGTYLSAGTKTMRLTIMDVYENSRTIGFTITSVDISLSSTFDPTQAFSGPIMFQCTPVGQVRKEIKVEVDGVVAATMTTSVSGRQQTLAIPQQTHGAHVVTCYFDAEINGRDIRSNVLRYEIICLEQMNDDTIIASTFNDDEVDCYTTLNIGYTVYDPTGLTTSITVYEDSVEKYTGTVDRTPRTYAYRADTPGEHSVRVDAGNGTRTFTFTVPESDIQVEPATDQLRLFLTSAGRTNDDNRRDEWIYESIEAELTGFGFTSDGWQLDASGIPALHVAGDARVTIPFQPFATDKRSSGFTFEIDFATSSVMDYDATILSCMSGGRGIEMTANSFILKSEQSELGMQFKEDEHIHAVFVVEKRSKDRLIYSYINGINSGVVQYPQDDDFSQATPVDITIGSNDCAVDLYTIRVYDNDLTRIQVLDNWLAATQDGELMRQRYRHNDVFDAYGNVVIDKLPSDLPYMIIGCPELPQYKGDKKTVDVTFVDPVDPSRSFSASGVQADVQGTSSQYYERKNYKLKYKNGFTMTSNGAHAASFPIRSGAIGGTVFTMKADVASSEGANNVELVRLYNDGCPYKTPAQQEDERVRQGIDGFPIVMFWRNTESANSNETTFLGKYNFNNDKGDLPIFGFAEGDESWEICNNTSQRVLWKSDDYESTMLDEDGKTIPAWTQDFESRYPEDYFDASQLKEFATWLKSTDQEQATGDALAEPVTYGGVEYSTDSAAYRLAKFKAEISDYVEMDSTIYYYIFTELFLMVDSRAKNAFPSFMGSAIASGN